MRFSDIPAHEFPLRYEKYSRLYDEIQAAAEGFDNLGTRDGCTVAQELYQVRAKLSRAWEVMREIEDRQTEH